MPEPLIIPIPDGFEYDRTVRSTENDNGEMRVTAVFKRMAPSSIMTRTAIFINSANEVIPMAVCKDEYNNHPDKYNRSFNSNFVRWVDDDWREVPIRVDSVVANML